MPGLLDYIPSQSDVQRTIADLLAKPRNRLRGLLSDPSGFLQSALSDVVPTDQQAQEQLARYRMPLSQDYAMGPSGYDNKMQDIALGALTVYHGSPHKFDKFDMSKIGSGEGAQAYGHGLYLAESPAVANEYAAKLGKPELVFGGKPITQLNVSQEAKDAAKWIESRAGAMSYGAQGRTARDDFSRLPEKIRKELGNVDLFDGGNLYKVDLPDEAVARFLDWDKPLSQQAPEVQAALSAYKGGPAPGGDGWGKVAGKSVDKSGADIYLDISMKNGNGSRSDQAATDYLNSLGIPGIRYLDGGSRNAGQGTYNYVVFDDTLPTILERNGQKLK